MKYNVKLFIFFRGLLIRKEFKIIKRNNNWGEVKKKYCYLWKIVLRDECKFYKILLFLMLIFMKKGSMKGNENIEIKFDY